MASPVDRLFTILDREVQAQKTIRRKQDPATAVGKRDGSRKNRTHEQDGIERASRIKLLTTARDMISGGWVQAEVAVNRNGKPVAADDPEAVAWCMDGAIQAAAYTRGARAGSQRSTKRIAAACRSVLRANGIPISESMNAIVQVADLNDNVYERKDQVLRALDKAIAKERAEAGR